MAAKKYLLTSEDFVKSCTNASDNLSGKYLQSAIVEAQDVALRGIIGGPLLAKLEQLRKDEALAGDYKELVDRCQYFLAYTALADVVYKSYKLTNFGVAKSSDENLQVATPDELAAVKGYYQAKADARCYDLQTWLLANRASFPELTEACCQRMRSNLYSAASCGIFLGGARGKMSSPAKCTRR